MLNASLRQLSLLLSEKKISSTELTSEFLSRIKALNPDLNAFITIDEEKSLDQANVADKMIAAGRSTPLTGIPIAQKDIFCARGWLTTCGSKMLSNFVSPYDATVVERFDQAGMVNLGKTNMDEFAMGSSNETSYYGPVKNPWDRLAVPGGSSGGSACAVAARLAPAATGSDTGGSIRQPAALCGISGIKPTYGLVSRYGMIAFASSLDQGGPMAKSAEDLALLLNTMIGFDERDSTSLQRAEENYTQDLEKPVNGLRIGLPKEFFAEGMSSDVSNVIEAALAEYRKLGATFVEVSLPNSKLAVPVYYVLAPAEASSNLSRFDGVRYGYRTAQYSSLEDLYTKTRAEGFGEEVKRRILIGTYVLSHGYYDAYYLQAQKLRRLIAEDFRKAFEQCDLIMGPTTPTVAFNIGEKCDDPIQMYLSDIYTSTASLAGLPGMSIPAGFGSKNRPVGLHIIGNYFREAQMLNVAHRYQQVTNWHELTPPETSN
ncbi:MULTISPECIES: Asp-tRNA(Asn)/Glu-tRNA(Gln) amidotransferase subunit GatA [Nitrosomonas]|uniref:Asp-tRNA(Asn)/Glu-tRNA(Gln) amidotransferase subunit GatA n=1 Tax=Nitrosomonas TaxID=914 RepID=UPI001935572B|nr:MULTISPECIES: Asp-tRNA(Asn)/Glu-tRNA(Gln) amidotransferase subunit GatA [Nitrosomonas]QOJ08170.1 MAG: Asp-tRNA(Asn)/Glu-tRNA(Gln) amidotransferase subunit GatA [Nitrosomonas sp. H1_AOB3]HRO56729.1 Asp-tRNA(Asn)/Glu-tRNA(Gln) amidotransferase subunit GatA [Nitrosomonas europaea]HUM74268.1 Asp-tRNA(Asn)/Glu-tRNA(Gln) amidotransferase subunit GatA [Nitrosomonas europaea]